MQVDSAPEHSAEPSPAGEVTAVASEEAFAPTQAPPDPLPPAGSGHDGAFVEPVWQPDAVSASVDSREPQWGAPDADRVIVIMGSGAGAAREAVDAMNAAGERVRVLALRLFRPFPTAQLLAALPPSVRTLVVLDRCKEPGAPFEPLHLDVLSAIGAGRLYQLCLTFPVRFAPPQDPASLFAWLVSRHPVDYAAWVSLPGFELLSASPERFLSLRGRTVTLRPMKGTRGLGQSGEAAVAEAMRDLAASVKDRAENVMIADLARNDLGRVCVPGSVLPAALFEVERYASVAQMTSTIRGELRDGLDVWDAFAAAFPPGSMTGAPKIEACRMIRELEAAPRGLYGGVLGWIEPDGDAEFSVVIRSLQTRDGEARWDIGGGIVHDSTADAEWAEAWAKFAPLRALAERPPET